MALTRTWLVTGVGSAFEAQRERATSTDFQGGEQEGIEMEFPRNQPTVKAPAAPAEPSR